MSEACTTLEDVEFTDILFRLIGSTFGFAESDHFIQTTLFILRQKTPKATLLIAYAKFILFRIRIIRIPFPPFYRLLFQHNFIRKILTKLRNEELGYHEIFVAKGIFLNLSAHTCILVCSRAIIMVQISSISSANCKSTLVSVSEESVRIFR